MPRKWMAVVLCAILLITTAIASAGPLVFKFAYDDAPRAFEANEHALAVTFKDLVESRTNREIIVELYPAGALGKERERFELVQSGIIQGTIASIGGIAQFVPEIGAIDIPFAIPSHAIAYRVYDGPFLGELRDEILSRTGVRLMGVCEAGGFYALTNNVRPIRTPADMKGVKFRTMEVPVQIRMMEALGGAATPIAWAELYTSLQTGVVNGQHNPVPIIVHGKLFEVQKYVTLLNHLYGTDWWLMNNDWLQSLSPEHRRIIAEAVQVAIVAGRGINRIVEGTDRGVAFLKEQGLEVYMPTPEERAQFADLAIPAVLAYVGEAYGEDGLRWANRFLQAIEEAEAEMDAVTAEAFR